MDGLKKGGDSEEVEIDLGDSSDPEEFDNGEQPQTLWKAHSDREQEESSHLSSVVDISDTKPLLNVRDPRGMNDCLKVTFEDVIAEPVSVRSGDRVWIWSHALFEVSRVWVYRIITVLLAIPMSILSGILFALLSCIHVWMISPCIKSILIGTRWLQNIWNVVLDIIVRPLLTSAGRCCSRFSIHLAEE
ncbi:caveolin-2 [Corythoichthys intestinalis]|uniref:caveolin-2 n=1 Tax=Corythoichthys intestinalis TaxID=161448 RepID=UPI0025A515C4|nr:caveolin-2 [Corythoichthys intestinalis]XP_061813432.1 caveolin-2-like [Nerophis lumbriciformis]